MIHISQKYRGNSIWFLQVLYTCFLVVWSKPIISMEYSTQLKAGNYYFIKSNNNKTRIHIDDFGSIYNPGFPQLPSKIFHIALPANATVNHVNIYPVTQMTIPGEFDIEWVNPIVSSNNNIIDIGPLLAEFRNTREKIYGTNEFIPKNTATFENINYFSNFPFVKIRFTPFSYNPSTKKLKFVDKLIVHIDYDIKKGNSQNEIEGAIEQKRINESIDNHRILQSQNTQSVSDKTFDKTSLLIISPQYLEKTIEPFIFWKTCLGDTIQHISVESIDSNVAGSDKADKIRNYLKKCYTEYKTENVLFIGHIDVIPMKTLYPNPDNHQTSGGVPSDFYYAELSSDFDSDGDGYPGEFKEDHIDWIPEINIGRIPWNDSTTVSNILKRLVTYEQDDGYWKKQGLLMGAISNYENENNLGYYYKKTDGAALMEKMKNNIFADQTVTTLYEKDGIYASLYPSDLPLNKENIFNSWLTGLYGCISWWSHGQFNLVSRKWWNNDDGDLIPESHEIIKRNIISTNDYPNQEYISPIIFANSCYNGWPEKTSLGRELIKSGSSSIISSSRTSWYVVGWDDIPCGGSASLEYYFWEELIHNQKRIGESVNISKLRYLESFNNAWQHLHNIYTFNLFGDPTLSLEYQEPLYGGISGILLFEDNDLSDLHIRLSNQFNLSFSAATEPNKKFQLNRIPAGNYMFDVVQDSIHLYSTDIQIINGEMHTINIDFMTTSIGSDKETIPEKDIIYQNYPNPFNNTTQIQFEISKSKNVNVIILNDKGQIVRNLWEGQKTAGKYSILWNGTDNNDNSVATGMYFYLIEIDQQRSIKKMLFVK